MIRPLLAESLKNILKAGKHLMLPALASTKIDGIRCLITPDFPQTRNGFVMPNAHIRGSLMQPDLVGLDLEITVGPLDRVSICADSNSACMSEAGESDFTCHVFDSWDHPNLTAIERTAITWQRFMKLAPKYPFLRYLEQRPVHNMDEVDQAIKDLAIGEGIILKRYGGLYKQTGRSTVNSQELIKIKPYEDDEAIIVEVVQGTRNDNKQEKDNFGYAKRSTAQAGKVLVDTSGALRVVHAKWGAFNVSLASVNHAMRKWIWDNKDQLLGSSVTYKFLPIGSLEKPRHPQFKFFRDHKDM